MIDAESDAGTKWLSVVGYEGKYEVSNTGHLRKTGGDEIGTYNNHDGYIVARLSRPRISAMVHRVVAQAFISNPLGLPFVNHIDCIRSNNVVSNLEWCTQWSNLNHSQNLGRMQRDYWVGKRSPNANLSEEIAGNIRQDYALGGTSFALLAHKYGTNKRTVGRIVSGETYVQK